MTTADCPLARRCLFTGLRDDTATLQRSGATDQQKLEALKLLAHWVADIHQPLHVSFKDDRGGNEINETEAPPCSGNLHRVWDSCILSERVLEEGGVQATATALRAEISATDREVWSNSTWVDWADESFEITTSEATGYCRRGLRLRPICGYDEANLVLDRGEPERWVATTDPYLDEHAGTVALRLQQAGVRLGELLREALGGGSRFR